MMPERMTAAQEPKVGDLRVYHIPQIPMSAFYVYVGSTDEALRVMSVLAEYDLFQLERNIKPDYSNVQGLEIYTETSNDGEEHHKCYEWEEWMDEEGYSIGERK